MYYESMPLYPPMRSHADGERCVKVPVFGECCPPCAPHSMRCCRRVIIENPCRPGETAEVLLGVDEGGNLLVCVRRGDGECACDPQPPCLPPPCRPPERPDSCRRGRLYGNWR